MAIRTYYWHDSIISKRALALRKFFHAKHAANFFTIGNSGDIVGAKILEYIYNTSVINDSTKGKRILSIGSIAHKILPGDLLCGIGANSNILSITSDTDCRIYGLRGPLSYELFKKAGHALENVNFLADPGLLLRKIIPNLNIKSKMGKVLFIPHYKERYLYKNKLINQYIEVVDIDGDPIDLGIKILEAECVLSSSLHGIIFSHSLNRPCRFILPQTNEPIMKYADYFESVNIADPAPLKNIYDYKPTHSVNLPDDIEQKINSIKFPTLDQLKTMGIA
jgi:pyruvyltransferase